MFPGVHFCRCFSSTGPRTRATKPWLHSKRRFSKRGRASLCQEVLPTAWSFRAMHSQRLILVRLSLLRLPEMNAATWAVVICSTQAASMTSARRRRSCPSFGGRLFTFEDSFRLVTSSAGQTGPMRREGSSCPSERSSRSSPCGSAARTRRESREWACAWATGFRRPEALRTGTTAASPSPPERNRCASCAGRSGL